MLSKEMVEKTAIISKAIKDSKAKDKEIEQLKAQNDALRKTLLLQITQKKELEHSLKTTAQVAKPVVPFEIIDDDNSSVDDSDSDSDSELFSDESPIKPKEPKEYQRPYRIGDRVWCDCKRWTGKQSNQKQYSRHINQTTYHQLRGKTSWGAMTKYP
jgi:hypothetical protein